MKNIYGFIFLFVVLLNVNGQEVLVEELTLRLFEMEERVQELESQLAEE
jgi:hypothetical protein